MVIRVKVYFGREEEVVNLSDSANVYDLRQAIKGNSCYYWNGRKINLGDFEDYLPVQALGIQHMDILRIPKPREFILKEMPNDNSCLFRTIAFIISNERGQQSDPRVQRRIIVDAILNDSQRWNPGVLGKSREEYIEWISKDGSWGGAIELAILSEHYGIELDSVDVQSGKVYRFGEDKGFPLRGFLIYSGIHYDAISEVTTESREVKLWSSQDDEALERAINLAKVLRASGQYTDVTNFLLICDVCKTKLKGESEAESHAISTNHYSFSEINH